MLYVGVLIGIILALLFVYIVNPQTMSKFKDVFKSTNKVLDVTYQFTNQLGLIEQFVRIAMDKTDKERIKMIADGSWDNAGAKESLRRKVLTTVLSMAKGFEFVVDVSETVSCLIERIHTQKKEFRKHAQVG